MLKPGDDDFVVLLDILTAPALGNEIDGLGGSTNKDDLASGPALRKRRVFSRADS